MHAFTLILMSVYVYGVVDVHTVFRLQSQPKNPEAQVHLRVKPPGSCGLVCGLSKRGQQPGDIATGQTVQGP